MSKEAQTPNLKILKKPVLITGTNGLLGQKLVRAFVPDFEVHGLGIKREALFQTPGFDYTPCDITDRNDTTELVKRLQPHYIINSAAYTHVDDSETNRETCWNVNVTGVENLAAAAKTVNATMVHISTDYVFDGERGDYTEDARPNPLGFYGRSKLAGENAIIGSGVPFVIVRTMVLYGVSEGLKPNFATWLAEQLRLGKPVNIVDDQFGHPTLVDDLAEAILEIVQLQKTGIFHVAGSECASRYEFALKLAEVFGFDRKLIHRVKTEDLGQKAKRPLNSRFNLDKLHGEVGYRLSDMEEGLRKFRAQLNKQHAGKAIDQ